MTKPFIFRLSLFSLSIFIITACGPQPEAIKETVATPPQTEQQAISPQTRELSEQQTEKLQQYLELSRTSEGPLRQQYIIEMAEWLYEQLELTAALETIQKLDPLQLSPAQTIRANKLNARILLSLGKPGDSLKALPENISLLSPAEQAEILDIQAQAYLADGYPFEAMRARINRDKLLNDEIALADNRYAIWRTLNLMSLSSLKQINSLPLDNETKGWIELAIVTKANQNNWQQLDQYYQDWQYKHPNHPAGGTFISTLASNQTDLIKPPKHIAVLLPVTGKHAGAARAIRDGFLSAYYHAGNTQRPLISVIDINQENTSVWKYYQKALQKGADFIVGPLSKPLIDELSQAKELEVPVLTFNYAEEQSTVTDNLFQFGLLPEDEATQIAALAIRQGKKHAAILVPDNSWGTRMQQTFQQSFESLGGEVRSVSTYQSRRNDYSNSIRHLLNLTQSQQRYNKVKRILGTTVKFEAYRRQDIDMIFIAGFPRAARSILPQLKFHHASDLQVYSTSHAFSGVINTNADRDINNLIYVDIPWVLEQNSTRASVEKNWPNSNRRYTRLYALGADAYHLIPYLSRLKNKSGERFNGYTGSLHLDALLRVHRELVWAQFVRGAPTPLPANDPSFIYQPEENPENEDTTL